VLVHARTRLRLGIPFELKNNGRRRQSLARGHSLNEAGGDFSGLPASREQDGREYTSEAVARAGQRLIDADLGGGVIKQRAARPGQGRSGGYRLLVAYRAKHRVVFLYGFAKRERENIEPDELVTLREICREVAGGGREAHRPSSQ
jgi:hypothetical protein